MSTNNKNLTQAILLTDNFLENFTLQHFLSLDDDQTVKRYDQLYDNFEKHISYSQQNKIDNNKYSDTDIDFFNGLRDVLREIAIDIEGDSEENIYELSIFFLELHKYQKPTNEKLCKFFGMN